MSSRNQITGLKRSALCLALSASLFSGAVLAQSAVGSIFGNAKPNATITVENIGSGTKRSITADKDGRYTFSQLPPGDYRVSSDGRTREIHVQVGTGANVSFVAASTDATTLDAVVVTGDRINPIDVSSVESTTVFSASQLLKVPVARDVSAVALLAPGSVRGDAIFGNLISVGGSSVAENGYYINGFDITNMRNLLSYFDMPYEATSEIQVKTGGYGAEYGRSLGGVINQVTKRGTNEWKGGASIYWEPASLRERDPNVPQRANWERFGDPNNPDDPRPPDPWLSYHSAKDRIERLKFNIYQGGPIIRDKLFFFVSVQGRYDTDEIYGGGIYTGAGAYQYKDSTPQGVLKLDWNITDNHLLELTAVGAPTKQQQETGQYVDANGDFYVDQPYNDAAQLDFSTTDDFAGGGHLGVLKYTGYLTDNFTVSAQAGRLEYINGYYTKIPAGIDCPVAIDSLGPDTADQDQTRHLGCWNPSYQDYYDNTVKERDIRKGYRLDAEWMLDKHKIRFGVDYEQILSNTSYWQYSGNNNYYRYLTADVNGEIFGFSGFTPGQNYVQHKNEESPRGAYSATNTAFYLEDNWQITDNLLLYGGLRRETFDNKNAAGETFIKADNQWSPRLGFSWDVNGDSSFKFYGSAGRYFIPIPNVLAMTLSNYFDDVQSFHTYGGIDPATGAPIGISGPVPFSDGSQTYLQRHSYTGRKPPDARVISARNLEPMSQDEFILGAQWTAFDNWTFGVRAVRREVQNGFDNYCTQIPYVKWGQENGYPTRTRQDWARVQSSCIFINPGKDAEVALHVDLDPNGPVTVVNLPARYFDLPSFKRKYNALELTAEKNTDKWSLQGSYTLSKSYGNAEGYVTSTYEDNYYTAHSIDFNNRTIQEGSYGNLPNDRTHVFKLFGSYNLSDEWRLGGNLHVESGRPLNCQGRPPVAFPRNNPNDQDAHNGQVPPGYTNDDLAYVRNWGSITQYCHDQPFTDTWTDGDGVVHQYTNYRATLHNRGDMGRTPWWWSFDFQASYKPQWAGQKLSLQVDVFNLFNRHKPTKLHESFDDQVDFEDDPNIPDSMSIYGPSANYAAPKSFQTPRYVQFSARYDW